MFCLIPGEVAIIYYKNVQLCVFCVFYTVSGHRIRMYCTPPQYIDISRNVEFSYRISDKL